MCRQFGFSFGAKGEKPTPAEIAAVLFPALTKGGPHAYGWITSQGTQGSVKVAKYAGRADTKAALRNVMHVDPEATILIGHTRWATHGSPLDMNNNHPVRHSNIIGVHNGVIRNYEKILAKTGRFIQRDGRESQVDSESIFAAVAKWGHSAGLRKVDGDMVAVYMNLKKPNLVTIARSEARPCHIGWTKNGSIFWASEKAALLRLEAIGIEFVSFSAVRPYRLLVIKNGSIVFKHTWKIVKETTYTYNPLRFDVDAYKRAEAAREVAKARMKEWRGTSLAPSPVPARTEPEVGMTLDQWREERHRKEAARIARDMETLVERRGSILDDEEEERFFYNGQWLDPADYVKAVEDDLGWGDDLPEIDLSDEIAAANIVAEKLA